MQNHSDVFSWFSFVFSFSFHFAGVPPFWDAGKHKCTNTRMFLVGFHLCFHVLFILLAFLHFGTQENTNAKITRGMLHSI